ncbi:MAG: hypothetical protein WC100_21265, partial [Sterolibacterium sp.]
VTPRRWRQLWYVPLLSLAMALMMVRTLAMAKILDIPGFAQFSAGQLASSTFCMLGCLGLYPLLQRELPVQIVRHRERVGAILLAQCLVVAVACALLGMVLAGVGVSVMGLSPALLAIGVLHGLSQQVFLAVTLDSRSRGQPLQFALQNLERAGMAFAVGCGVGLVLESAAAVLLAEAAVSLLLTLKTMRGVLRRSRLKATVVILLATRRMGRIPWSSAMALMAVMFVAFAILNADRWVAAQLLQPTAFALYAFAWTLLLVAQSMQAVINASFFPLLARRFASTGSATAFGLCARASIGLLLAFALVSWPVGWLLEAAVSRWFPGYAESTVIVGVFLWVAALRISDFWGSYLIIIGKEKRLLLVYLVVGILVFAAWMYMVNPWANQAIAIGDIAWLAVALSVAGYIASLLTAWSAKRSQQAC